MARVCDGTNSLQLSGTGLSPFSVFGTAGMHPLSMSCWFLATDVSAVEKNIFCVQTTGSGGRGYRLGILGTTAQCVVFTNSLNYTLTSVANFSTTGWNHIGIVGASTSDHRFYLNGVELADTTLTGGIGSIAINTTTIGSSIAGTPGPFTGTAAECAAWNIGLTAAEMVALSKGASPASIRASNLLQYYRCSRGGSGVGEPNLAQNSAAYDLTLSGGTLATAPHPPVQSPFAFGQGWRGIKYPFIQFVAPDLATGSPVIGAPVFAPFAFCVPLATSAPVLGQPAAKDKSPTVAFTKTLGGSSAGWQGRTLRQRFEPGMLSAVDPGGIRTTLQFAAGTSGQIDALYIGHAAAIGDPYDFDGNQVQLKFSGANTMAVAGAGSVRSDTAAFAYDPTRALIVSAAFSGAQVNLAAF